MFCQMVEQDECGWYVIRNSTAGKNRLYFKLSKELGIKSEDCHFGYMDYEQLQKALNIMKSWGDFKIR